MNEDILAALAKAKWNESVRVDIDIENNNENSGNGDGYSNGNGTKTMLLVPRLDRENGGIRWEDANVNANANATATVNTSDNENDSEPKPKTTTSASASATTAETTAHIHTKKWIFPMLNDQRRNNLYQAAIEQASKEAVRRFRERSSTTANSINDSINNTITSDNHHEYVNSNAVLRTLDIGSGTGLLAMLSERHLSKALARVDSDRDDTNTNTNTSIEVTSVEMAGPMADMAKQTVELAARSGNTNTASTVEKIHVIEGHSCQIPSMARSSEGGGGAGAMLCTSELLESGLLGEGWLPAMRDAWERHLHPDAVVVPQRARVVAVLVEGAAGFCGPHRHVSLEPGTTRAEHNAGVTSAPPSLRLFTTEAHQMDEHNNENDSDIGMLSDGSYDPVTGRRHGIQLEIHADRYLRSNSHSFGKHGGANTHKNDRAQREPVLRVLSDPIRALSFDVTHPSALPHPDPTSRSPCRKRFVAKASGRAEGIMFWWELDLYGNGDVNNDNDLTYSTEPGSGFQDHWHQCLYVFPPSSEQRQQHEGNGKSNSNFNCGGDGGIELKEGTEYTLLASHTDSRVHFSIAADADADANESCDSDIDVDSDSEAGGGNPREPNPKRSKPTVLIPAQVPPIAGPRRCWQLNDVARSAKFRDGIEHALAALKAAASTSTNATTTEHTNTNTNSTINSINVLDVSDFSLCGMMASLLGAKIVTSIESSSSGLPLATARVAQIGNALSRGSINFQIVQCHAESLTREIVLGNEPEPQEADGGNGIVDLVVGEPYYEMLEGWPIETALNYFYTIRRLKSKGIVKPKALCVPSRAVVLACGIECADLGTAYQKHLSTIPSETNPNNNNDNNHTSVDSTPTTDSNSRSAHVCGFDHTPVVVCWNYDQHGISIPLWEYNDVVPVTEIVEVGMIDYETNSIHLDNRGTGDNPNDNDETTSTPVLWAPFTKENHTCHAIAFWVDYKIRSSKQKQKPEPQSSHGSDSNSAGDSDSTTAAGRSLSSSFETLSTGFLEQESFVSPQASYSSPSCVAARQTVRILAKAQPAIIGESLAIPSHGLEL